MANIIKTQGGSGHGPVGTPTRGILYVDTTNNTATDYQITFSTGASDAGTFDVFGISVTLTAGLTATETAAAFTTAFGTGATSSAGVVTITLASGDAKLNITTTSLTLGTISVNVTRIGRPAGLAFTNNFEATKLGHVVCFDGSPSSTTGENTADIDIRGQISVTLSDTSSTLSYNFSLFSGQSLDFSELGGMLIRDDFSGTEFKATSAEIVVIATANCQAVIELWA